MNRHYEKGLSCIAAAKAGIETFFKWENKRNDRQNGRYLLVSSEEFPHCIKSGFNQSSDYLLKRLKELQAHDLSNTGACFSAVFDYLNAYRFSSGLETVGSGRHFFINDTALIFYFTDGGKFFQQGAMTDKLVIHGLKTPGCDLYQEPFRWDQRLYTIMLNRNPKTALYTQVKLLSDNMFGDLYFISSIEHLTHCMENCMGARKPPHPNVMPFSAIACNQGVVVNFEELLPKGQTSNREKLVVFAANVALSSRYYPIPENYWPENINGMPPARQSQPTIYFSVADETHFSLPDGFPCDRHSMQQGALCSRLGSKSKGTCWPLYMLDSHKTPGIGHPFGFLKVSESNRHVSLYVLPYNFPKMIKLVDQFRHYKRDKNSKPNSRSFPLHVTQSFTEYLMDIPPYYWQPIRVALSTYGIGNLMPAQFIEGNSSKLPATLAVIRERAITEFQRLNRLSEEQPKLSDKNQLVSGKLSQSGNPFDVPRNQLLETLNSSRENIIEKLLGISFTTKTDTYVPRRIYSQREEDEKRSLPLSTMGDYALAMNGRQTLRNPFEDDEAVRLREKTVFGNPYQTEKKMSIDEEDEASTAENRQPSISVEGDRIDAASASDTVSSDTCSVSSSRTARSVRQSLGGSMRKARLKSTSLTMQIMRVAVIDRVPSLYHIPSILAYPDGTREAEENGCHLQKELGRLHEVHRENQRLAAEQAAAATAASVNVWREGVKVKSAEPQKMTDPSTSLSASSSMSPYGDSHPELLDHAYTLPESSIDPPTLFAPIVSHDPLMDLDSDSESLTPSATSPSSTTASSLVLSSYPSLSRKRKLGSSLDSSLSLLPSNNQIEVAAVASAEISNSSKEIPDTMVMKLDNLGRDEILLKISRLFRQCSRDFSSVSISNLMLSIKQSGSLDELDKELLFNHAQRMAHRLKRHF